VRLIQRLGSTVRIYLLGAPLENTANRESIPKLLKLCRSVQKWRLCIRFGDFDWTHASGAWVMVGDAVHATLPYLASGYVKLASIENSHLLTDFKSWDGL